MIVSEDTEYVTQGKVTGDVTIKGDDSRPVVSVMDTAEHSSTSEHGILYADGNHKVSISNLGTLNVESTGDDKDALVGLNVWSGASVDITNVDTVNIGTADEAFKTDNYAIQAIGGNVNITDVGDVNIFTTETGISAQHGAGNGDYSVVIDARGDVNIKTESVAVRAMSLNNDVGSAGISIHADGKVTLESTANNTIQSWDYAGQYSGNGVTKIDISGENGVDIIAPDDIAAIGMLRKTGNTSSLTIESNKGDVNISGKNGFIFKPGTTDSVPENLNIEGKVTGQNVNVNSTETAIQLQNGSLALGVNQDGGAIQINSKSGEAVNVSGTKGSLTFGDGTKKTDVYVNGYVQVTDEANVTFAGNTTTHVDSKYLMDASKAFITTDNGSGSVTFADGSHLDIGNVAAGTTLNFSDNADVSGKAAAHILTDNVLQKFIVQDGKLVAGTVTNEVAQTLLAGSLLTNVAVYASGNAGYDDVKALVDGENAVEALNSAAGLSAMAGVEHGTYTAAGIFNDAVADHLMNRNDEDVWAYGFHNKENVNGLSFGADYDAQYNGVVAGADLYRNGGTVAGIALSYADGNVSGSNGFASTQNDADYYGASLYARFDRGSYDLLGDISYMKGDHDVTQWNKGQQITASPDSDAVSVGVKAVKDFTAGESGTLTPYIGVRYLRLSTDGFTASNGLHYDGDDQDLVLIPVGVNYSAAITGGSWTFRPYAGVGYIWNAGDKSADQTVTLGTAADSFSYDTVDSGSFLTRVGFTADHGDMSYGVGYSYQKGDSVSNNAWTLSASFRF